MQRVVSLKGRDTQWNRVNYLWTEVVQSNKYYMSRAVGVTSEVGLTTDRDLSVPIFDERPTRRTSVAQGLLDSSGRRAVAQTCQKQPPEARGNDRPARMPDCLLKISARSRDLSVPTLLKKHDVFNTSDIPEVMWYEPLYNTKKWLMKNRIVSVT